MAMMRQRAGTTFDEIYLDHSLDVRKQLIERIDDALDDDVRADALKQMLRELKSQLDADGSTRLNCLAAFATRS
ncbi:MAG: hypothetical protein F6K28_19285, partial [Microcoleus sp. SIO2G3]|nr:hypothetical protein [Microcoleus sp. SIO2G3]